MNHGFKGLMDFTEFGGRFCFSFWVLMAGV